MPNNFENIETPNEELLKKYDNLREYIKKLGSVAIAFSSGVDSTFLLYTAYDVLGKNAIAITAVSNSFPKREKDESESFCKNNSISHYSIELDQMQILDFSENHPDRCYVCKKAIFEKIIAFAKEKNVAAVAEGSNMDDLSDYRPGLRAIAELGVLSPLRECGFSKLEIRRMLKFLGIDVATKPSFACLASRFPYGEKITNEKLAMVEKGENLLFDMGFTQFRVRIHGDIARIELVPEEFSKIMDEEVRVEVYEKFKDYGFSYVALDLKGYRTGSLNETLNLDKK